MRCVDFGVGFVGFLVHFIIAFKNVNGQNALKRVEFFLLLFYNVI